MKIKLFKKINNDKFLFVALLLILWAAISCYKYPVFISDALIAYRMQLSGIKILKKEGLEYAYLNNCKTDDNCKCKVIFHGIGDNFQNWEQVLKGVKKESIPGKWIAFNYPGTGNSDPFPDNSYFRVNKFASEINSRITKLCPEPVDIIANSMGTWISFWWVIQHPESINSLIMLNAVGAYAEYSWLADAMVNPSIDKLKALHERSYHEVFPYPDQVYVNTMANMEKRGNRIFMLSQDRTLAVDKYLPTIQQRTFIGWGKSDGIIPIETYQSYLKLMPNVQGQLFENCGHVPNSECPEEVVSVIKKFYE